MGWLDLFSLRRQPSAADSEAFSMSEFSTPDEPGDELPYEQLSDSTSDDEDVDTFLENLESDLEGLPGEDTLDPSLALEDDDTDPDQSALDAPTNEPDAEDAPAGTDQRRQRLDPYRHSTPMGQHHHHCYSSTVRDEADSLEAMVETIQYRLATFKTMLADVQSVGSTPDDLSTLFSEFERFSNILNGLHIDQPPQDRPPGVGVIQVERDYYKRRLQELEASHNDTVDQARDVQVDAHIGRSAHTVALGVTDAYDQMIRAHINNDSRYNGTLDDIGADTTEREDGAIDALLSADFTTIRQLCLLTYRDLVAVDGIGPSRAGLLRSMLERLGYVHRLIPPETMGLSGQIHEGQLAINWGYTNDLNSDPDYDWRLPEILTPAGQCSRLVFYPSPDGRYTRIHVVTTDQVQESGS